MFKAPEYCAACHKQFIDQEVNRVGWVQLQNQYDNWKASHWFVEDDPSAPSNAASATCRLVESTDPASGDATDYNRSPDDGRHRITSLHRRQQPGSGVARARGLGGAGRLTDEWLQGKLEIPEIADKWRPGPVVTLVLDVPETIEPGQELPLRVVMTANKVGHDFPTGPLDIIQSWLEVHVFDDAGREVYASGRRDERNFIEPGASCSRPSRSISTAT